MGLPRVLVYCGVHKGATFSSLADRFDVAYGFEADPGLAAAAQALFASRGHVKIIHAALCERNGSVPFHVHSDPAASSLGRLGESYRANTGNDIRPIDSIEVPALNLGDFLRSEGIALIDVYYSDIQGMDLAVLGTLAHLIRGRRIREITCETERPTFDAHAYEGLPSNRQDGFTTLLGPAYRVVHRQQVGPRWAHQDVMWRLRGRHRIEWHARRLRMAHLA